MEHVKSQEYRQSQMVRWRIFISLAILALTSLFCTTQLGAEIYKWVDENGVIHYSNRSTVNAGNVSMVFDEYPHDEAADPKQLKTDQERVDAITQEIRKDEQQASVEEQKKLEQAKQNQPDLIASKCFSPSYSIYNGRTVDARIIPRNLGEGQYLALQELFQGLKGDWIGTGWLLSCTKTEGVLDEQIYNYSIRSEGIMRSREQFVFESTLQSEENWTTEDEILRLYLNEKILAQKPKLAVSDIELIKVTGNELAYVSKKNINHASGVRKCWEKMITIRKTDEASVWFGRIIYFNGKLVSKSSWHLYRR